MQTHKIGNTKEKKQNNKNTTTTNINKTNK